MKPLIVQCTPCNDSGSPRNDRRTLADERRCATSATGAQLRAPLKNLPNVQARSPLPSCPRTRTSAPLPATARKAPGHRHAPTQHERIGIENIDDDRERPPQSTHIVIESRAGLQISASHRFNDCLTRKLHARRSRMVALQSASRHPRLHASALSAPALSSIELLGPRPRQRHVSPFAADSVRAFDQLPVYDQTSAATRTENHREGNSSAGSRAIDDFRQRQAVGIVRKTHLATECRSQVLAKTPSVEIRRVRIAHDAGARRDRTRRSDTDGAASSRLQFHAADELADSANRIVVAAWVRRTHACQKFSFRIQCRHFDLGTAEIDADLNGPSLARHSAIRLRLQIFQWRRSERSHVTVLWMSRLLITSCEAAPRLVSPQVSSGCQEQLYSSCVRSHESRLDIRA